VANGELANRDERQAQSPLGRQLVDGLVVFQRLTVPQPVDETGGVGKEVMEHFTLLSILPTFKIEIEPFSSWRLLFGMFPFLQKLFADGGYQGSEFTTALATVRPRLNVEIVKRSDRAKEFVVLSTCLAQSLPKARQGLAEPQSKSACVPAPRLNSAHAQKTL
jgi:hypothetical protein